MAVKRKKRVVLSAIGGALEGFGEGAAAGLRRKFALDDQERQNRAITRRQLDTDVLNHDQALEEKVATGAITPEQARQMAISSRRSAGSTAPLPDFMGSQASVTDRVAPVRRKIESATSPAMVPTEAGIYSDVSRETREIPPVPGAGEALAFSPQMAGAMDVRRQKLTAFDTEREQKRTEAVRTAGESAGATAQATEDVAARNAPAVLGRKGAEALQQAGIATDQAVNTQRLTGPMRTAEAISTAGGSRQAILNVDQEMGAGDFKPDKTTPDERKAFRHASAMATSQEILALVEPKVAKRGWVPNLLKLNAPDQIADPLTRSYYQALRVYINGLGRRDSGATITPDELTNYMRTFGYTAGDDPKVQQQKITARREAIRGMATEAGKELGGLFVTIDEVRAAAQAQGISEAAAVKKAKAEGAKVIY